MAGEIINLFSENVATTAVTYFQPAVQTEWIIFSVLSDQDDNQVLPHRMPSVQYGLYNGTLTAYYHFSNGAHIYGTCKLGATNTDYIVVKNTDANAADIAISGVRTT